MNPLDWQELDVKKTAWFDLYFRQAAGMEVDPAEIAASAQATQEHARKMALQARQDPDAWRSIASFIIGGELTPLRLEIYKQTRQHLVFKEFEVNGRPATAYSKFQYLNQEPDAARRHAFLEQLMQGHPAVDDAYENYRNRYCELAKEWRYSPLQNLLDGEELTIAELRQLLTSLATAMQPRFLADFAHYRQHILGINQGEPWEDLLTFLAGRWSALAEQAAPDFDLGDAVAAVKRTARTMGFDPDAIHMDLEDRPNKRLGASAWPIRIPDDIRMMLKTKSRLDDPRLLYHEMGHALHFANIDPKLPFPNRYEFTHGVAETFSYWFESLLRDPLYVQKELGFDEKATAEMVRLMQFIFTMFATWMAAESLCLLDYMTDGPFTLAEMGARYSSYMQQFVGFSVPPMAIRAQGIFIHTLNLNGVGFGPAFVRLGHLLDQLENIRRDWWNVPEAAALMRGYMRGGRYPGFPRQMLDIAPTVARFGMVQHSLAR